MRSVYLITPVSDACADHLAEHMPEDAPRLGRGYGVECAYVQAILDDLTAHGFLMIDDYEVTE
jgi:hypothetical protein